MSWFHWLIESCAVSCWRWKIGEALEREARAARTTLELNFILAMEIEKIFFFGELFGINKRVLKGNKEKEKWNWKGNEKNGIVCSGALMMRMNFTLETLGFFKYQQHLESRCYFHEKRLKLDLECWIWATCSFGNPVVCASIVHLCSGGAKIFHILKSSRLWSN